MKLFSKKKEASVEEEIFKIVKEVGEIETDIQRKDRIKDIGIDSIKFMNLLISIESIIGQDIEDVIEDVDFSKLETVGDIIELVERIRV